MNFIYELRGAIKTLKNGIGHIIMIIQRCFTESITYSEVYGEALFWKKSGDLCSIHIHGDTMLMAFTGT